MLRLTLSIALSHLAHRKRQTVVSVAGVMMGVGFFIAISAMMQGFQKDFKNRIIDVSPHVVMKDEYRHPPIQPAQLAFPKGAVAVRGVKPKDVVRGIRNAGQIEHALAAMPGLAVAPTLSGQVILRYVSKDVSASLIGIVPANERRVTNIEKDLVAGRLDDLYTTANGIILGSGLADSLGVKVGDSLSAISPTGEVMRMKVVGLIDTGIVAIDKTESYALLKKVQALLDRPNIVNRLRMRLNDVTQATPLARELEQRYGYRTESWEETNKNVLGIFVIQNAIMYSTTGAILLVACFGIFNVISTVIYEKARDIAILKSMGFEEGDIRRIFLVEGLLLGLVGALAGWGVGYGLTELLASVKFTIEGFVKAQGFILDRSFTNYLIGGGMAAAAATLAAYLPARKAARLNPVDIVRGAA